MENVRECHLPESNNVSKILKIKLLQYLDFEANGCLVLNISQFLLPWELSSYIQGCLHAVYKGGVCDF